MPARFGRAPIDRAGSHGICLYVYITYMIQAPLDPLEEVLDRMLEHGIVRGQQLVQLPV